jgi:ribulose-phosphate 3-epimerase
MKKDGQSELSCSVISGDPLTIREDIKHLERGGIDSFHFDVMDGIFVPRIGLHPEYLKMLRELTSLPIEIHLMLENPEPFIEHFSKFGKVKIIPHIESMRHPIRTLMKIRDENCTAGVAINPGTHLSIIEPVMNHIDSVLLMSINPGIVGHKLLDNTFERLDCLRNLIGKDKNIKIILDGGVTFENAVQLINAGADSIVCGAGTVFKDKNRVLENTSDLRNLVKNISVKG